MDIVNRHKFSSEYLFCLSEKKFHKLVLFLLAVSFLILISFILCSCQGTNNTVKSNNIDSDKKICFVPLDTRSITYDYPIKLATTYGINVVYPDESQMTFFKDNADVSIIQQWTKDNSTNCDALVVSAEQLVYGGLIQMRNYTKDNGSKDNAINLLKEIKQKKPNMKIYLSNVLMRTSNTILSTESKDWWTMINEYSQYVYKAKILNDSDAQVKVKELEEKIPSDVLNEFTIARENAHKLNLECINLALEGVVDEVMLYQEDCPTLGIQKIEQIELENKISESNCGDKIIFANGTDEGGSELIMVAASTLNETNQLNINVESLGINKTMTAKFEDKPFMQNLQQHMKGMNINLDGNSNSVLFILFPKTVQGDYAEADSPGYVAYTTDELNNYVNQIVDAQNQGKHCYLLDLDSANGGCSDLLIALGNKNATQELYGYSGWNTACNSLGTLLAQIYACRDVNSADNQKLLKERVIDDVVYQSNVRASLNNQLTADGENIYAINDIDSAEKYLYEGFSQKTDLIKTIFSGTSIDYNAFFRWPRTFDIGIDIDK